MLPPDIRAQLDKVLESAKEQGLVQSQARITGILAAIDNIKDNDSHMALLDAVDALRDVGPALEAFKEEGVRHVLFEVSNKATELADAIESKPEKERLARAAESKRLKEEALARVRAK